MQMKMAEMKTQKKCISFLGLIITFALWWVTGGILMAQTSAKQITGTVTDITGVPLPGVAVMIKNSTVGTITDIDGNFSLIATEGAETIVFSFMGFKTQELSIAGKNFFKVSMQDDAITMDEVVVVGYGTQKKATLTGAITNVGTKELLQSSQANVSNALVGRLSGLLSVQSSGEPGKDQSTLRIRGIGTFVNEDGVDLQGPLVMVDGIETPNFNVIDPNEIETVSILKDASATAVYGVRGANGVILITTKRGTISKPKVSVSTSFALTGFTDLRKNMNAYDWACSFNEALYYDSYLTGTKYEPRFDTQELIKFKDGSDPLFYPDTDWYGMLFKDYSYQSQHNININGGTEKVKYFLSLGYFDQNGMYNNTQMLDGYDAQVKYKRYNFRSNFDFQITKGLNLQLNISNQLDDRNAPEIPAEHLVSNAGAQTPTSGPGIWEGKLINNLPGRYDFIENPIKSLVMSPKIQEFRNQFNVSGRLNYKLDFIAKGLSAHAMLSYQNYYNEYRRITKTGRTYDAYFDEETQSPVILPVGEETRFAYGVSHGKNRKVYIEAGFDYSRSFGNHTVGALLLYNQSKYFDPGLAFVVPNGYQGVVGRVTYDYKSKYLLEFNMGYNGTENFAPKKRFGFFPAYSLGWVLSEEEFFPENKAVSYVKIRGSYGEVGNDKIGGERFLYRPTAYVYDPTSDTHDPINAAWYWGTYGKDWGRYNSVSEGKIGNPDLTWERAAKMNVGVNINFWNDRIALTADWFRENRTQILTNQNTAPAIVGANLPAYNMGEMKNGGFDGEIMFRDRIRSFGYWVKGVFTFARNEIVFMDEVKQPYEYLQRTGKRYNQYFGYVVEGFYNTWEEVNDVNRPVYAWQNNKLQPGDFKYKDVNGDGLINEFDQVPLGYSDFPEIAYGISFGGDYRGFDFSVLFQGAENVSFRASKKSTRGFQEEGGAVDYLKDYSWTQERYESGAEIRFPHLSSSGQVINYLPNSVWIEDASYLRLKNIEIGYTFRGKGLKTYLGLESARLYVNANNIYTWKKLFPGEDPEIPTYNDGNYEPYPLMRNVNFGLNINF